ncbi:MAG TPA: hypothetical protein VFX79_01320, partial [Candidatus Saccharimonadales bacterium]|nr:hypothetical protein [Candidatus Saccharimonadales bacterium]
YATIVIAVSIAAFLVVFSLVASKALLDQRAYQSKVIGAKQEALETLEENLVAADQLTTSYQEFIGATTNVLGGNPFGDADQDGDNARIILDALPSKYDFPALTTSVDKLLRDKGVPPASISGTDDEASYSSGGASDSSGGSSGVVEMPFSVEVSTASAKGKFLLGLFEKSIRPIDVQTLSIKGTENKLEFSINAVTYFQPEKRVNVRTEAIR